MTNTCGLTIDFYTTSAYNVLPCPLTQMNLRVSYIYKQTRPRYCTSIPCIYTNIFI